MSQRLSPVRTTTRCECAAGARAGGGAGAVVIGDAGAVVDDGSVDGAAGGVGAGRGIGAGPGGAGVSTARTTGGSWTTAGEERTGPAACAGSAGSATHELTIATSTNRPRPDRRAGADPVGQRGGG